LLDQKDHHAENIAVIQELRSMVTLQTQQIMHMMELQVKYGLNDVVPEEELRDFTFE